MIMNRKEFKEILKTRVLLTDGALGTELYKKGYYINKLYETIHLSQPEILKEIHKSYLKAGANILLTNTFQANYFALKQSGLQDKVVSINQKAVEILKELQSEADFLIAGSVGPTGEFSGYFTKVELSLIRKAFKEQFQVLLANGVQIIILETFNSFAEIKLATQVLRELSKAIPVIASMTFPVKDETIFGQKAAELALLLSSLDVDLIGLNCSTGPQRALDLLKIFTKNSTKPLYVSPNAGYPKVINGRTIYLANEELFGNYAARYLDNGAVIIGGCCGTTPEIIKQMAKVVRQKNPAQFWKANCKAITNNNIQRCKEVPLCKRSLLGAKLGKELFYSLELLPERSPVIKKSLEKVASFKENIEFINIPDGPRASARMGIGAVAHLIQQNSKKEAIAHYCCRDRNILGIQSDLLALHALGIRNILAVTGDPPKLGNYPDATAVFDIDSIGLIRLLKNLNQGLDIVGNELEEATSFVIGAGVNPSAENLTKELERLKQKIKAGAEFIMTQPVYEHQQFTTFLKKVKTFKVPLVLGISPLVSYKMAEFQHNEIPGMEISAAVLKQFKETKSKKEARELGIKLAVEQLKSFKKEIAGIYFMAQGKVTRKMTEEILERSGL